MLWYVSARRGEALRRFASSFRVSGTLTTVRENSQEQRHKLLVIVFFAGFGSACSRGLRKAHAHLRADRCGRIRAAVWR
jgi:hypothetical protein